MWTYVSLGAWTSSSFSPKYVGVPGWATEVMLSFNCSMYSGGIYAFQGNSSVGACVNAGGSAYGQGIANADTEINIWNPSVSNFVTISAYR